MVIRAVPIIKAIFFKKSYKLFIESHYRPIDSVFKFWSTHDKVLVSDEILHWYRPLKNEITFSCSLPAKDEM